MSPVVPCPDPGVRTAGARSGTRRQHGDRQAQETGHVAVGAGDTIAGLPARASHGVADRSGHLRHAQGLGAGAPAILCSACFKTYESAAQAAMPAMRFLLQPAHVLRDAAVTAQPGVATPAVHVRCSFGVDHLQHGVGPGPVALARRGAAGRRGGAGRQTARRLQRRVLDRPAVGLPPRCGRPGSVRRRCCRAGEAGSKPIVVTPL